MRAISFVTGSLMSDHRRGDVENTGGNNYVRTCVCQAWTVVDGLNAWALIDARRVVADARWQARRA